MRRRSFFQALSAFAAALVLPPIRAARAVRSRVRHVPRWLSGRKHWEHLSEPVPDPSFERLISPNDARIVCRVLGPTHFSTNLHPDFGGFEAALEEAGWWPEEIARRMDPNYGKWGVSVPCESCTRRVWIPAESAESTTSMGGWRVELKTAGWVAHCPDHVGWVLSRGREAGRLRWLPPGPERPRGVGGHFSKK